MRTDDLVPNLDYQVTLDDGSVFMVEAHVADTGRGEPVELTIISVYTREAPATNVAPTLIALHMKVIKDRGLQLWFTGREP
jgi:hypothetical protein